MDRRNFISAFASTTTLALLPDTAAADIRCVPINPYISQEACVAGLRSITMPYSWQRQDQWCWAACIQMVMLYYGHAMDQADIVRSVYGADVNLPATNQHIINSFSRQWIDKTGKTFATQCDVLWDMDMGYGHAAAAPIACRMLADNQPLIVGTLGHAMVLTRVNYIKNVMNPTIGQVQLATVRDPWPSHPPVRDLSPMEWANIRLLIHPRIIA